MLNHWYFLSLYVYPCVTWHASACYILLEWYIKFHSHINFNGKCYFAGECQSASMFRIVRLFYSDLPKLTSIEESKFSSVVLVKPSHNATVMATTGECRTNILTNTNLDHLLHREMVLPWFKPGSTPYLCWTAVVWSTEHCVNCFVATFIENNHNL